MWVQGVAAKFNGSKFSMIKKETGPHTFKIAKKMISKPVLFS
jgi:hypothetical protein